MLALLLPAASCLGEHTVEPGESFTLRVGESAAVRGTGIRIRLDRVGHGWLAQGGAHFLFADLTVTSEAGSRSLTVSRRNEITIGDYTLLVVGIVEQGPDSEPDEGSRCTLRVVGDSLAS